MPTIPYQGLSGNRAAEVDKSFRAIPRAETQLVKANIFKRKNIAVNTVIFEERDGRLVVIPSNKDPAPSTQFGVNKGKIHRFGLNNHRLDDVIWAKDLDGYQSLSPDLQLRMEAEVLSEKMADISLSHDLTEERHYASLLQGRILNTDDTVLLDIYEEFGLNRANYTIDFDLGSSSTSLGQKLNTLLRNMQDNLLGERMTGISVYCTRTFIDSLLSNADFRDIMKQSPLANNLLQDATRGLGTKIPGFERITFYEYYENVNGISFMPDTVKAKATVGAAFAIPTGTLDTFVHYQAPAVRMSTVNKTPVGNGRYIKTRLKDDDTGLQIWTENRFLPMVKRPKLLWQITA